MPRAPLDALRLDRRSAAGLALGLLALVLAVDWVATHDWRGDPPSLELWPAGPRSGDEVHYSILIHSLLYDGDLRLRDDYESAAGEGYEAGRFYRGHPLDHHTLLLDPATGAKVRWSEVWDAGILQPCDTPGCVPFGLRPGAEPPELEGLIELPTHPPAFAAIMAALLWPFTVEPQDVDPVSARILRVLGALTLLATALAALRLGLGPKGALAAAALLGLASPWLAYVKSIFSEGTSAAFLAMGLLALLAGIPWLAAVAAVLLFWMKPALVVVGGGWILERAWARDWNAAFQITGVMLVGGLAHLAYNHALTGDLLISGNAAWVPPRGVETLLGNAVHPRYGVVTFLPWLVPAALALGWGAFRRRERPPCLPVVLPAALHWALLSLYGALGATCYGPRYWIPFVPAFALLAVADARGRGRAWQAGLAALGLLGALWSVPAALQYERVWDEPPWYGLAKMARGQAAE